MTRFTDLASFFFAQVRGAEEERDRVYEPVIGIVTDNNDPQKMGRVKIKLPTISADDTTWWAPVVSVGAGNHRGWFFLPEVNDEVLVMFEHGDITRPVVIGQLWNGKDKPPLSNTSGDNGQRAFVSRAGSKILFDDKEEKIVVEDSGGQGRLTVDAKNKKITLEALQGDAVIVCKDDLTIVAKEVDVQATTQLEISSATADVKGGSDQNVIIKGAAMVQVQGAQTSINSGSAQAPQAPTANPAEVPDVDGGTGSASSSPPPQSSAPGSGTASGSSAPPASAPGGAANTPAAQPEPQPLLVAALWSKDKVAPGTAVKLSALCADMSGKSASFTIHDADDPGRSVGSLSGSCGDASVEASWTTPSSGPPSRFTFDVEADGQRVSSGVLTLVKPVEVKLILDEEPAANVRVKLKVDPGGDELRASADEQGVVKFDEAPLGNYTLVLEET